MQTSFMDDTKVSAMGPSYSLGQRFSVFCFKINLHSRGERGSKGGNANLKTRHTELLRQEIP